MTLVPPPAIAHPDTHRPRCSEVHQVWSPSRWRRRSPKQRTIEALRTCRNWQVARVHFYAHRRAMLWREEFKPFVYPDGTRWAVPWPIAVCESGEDYFVGPYGAYGLILEPPYMSPREQDEAAHRLYVEYGEGPWAPFESGCAER